MNDDVKKIMYFPHRMNEKVEELLIYQRIREVKTKVLIGFF